MPRPSSNSELPTRRQTKEHFSSESGYAEVCNGAFDSRVVRKRAHLRVEYDGVDLLEKPLENAGELGVHRHRREEENEGEESDE